MKKKILGGEKFFAPPSPIFGNNSEYRHVKYQNISFQGQAIPF
jgi:hypothetical protein